MAEKTDLIIPDEHSHQIVYWPGFDHNRSGPVKPRDIFSKETTAYFHIPFCTGSCEFCHYYRIEKPDNNLMNSYIKSLKKEVALFLEASGPRDIKHLYFGGGTPTYLPTRVLDDILNYAEEALNVDSASEITVEISPETIISRAGEDKLKAMRENRVNRINLGIQTFDDYKLSFVGRRYNSKEAKSAFYTLRKFGFDNINIDLMRGLPSTDLKQWKEDLDEALRLDPESITIYALQLKPAAPLYKTLMDKPEIFPDKINNLLFFTMAIDRLGKAGYNHNPVTWFAKPGFEYKQQLFKWKGGEQIAFGPSSYSFINGYQYFNISNINDYLDCIKNGKLPISKGIKLTAKEQMIRTAVFAIKTFPGIDKSDFTERFGCSIEYVLGDVFKRMEENGLIEDIGNIISLTPLGVLFSEQVCREIAEANIV